MSRGLASEMFSGRSNILHKSATLNIRTLPLQMRHMSCLSLLLALVKTRAMTHLKHENGNLLIFDLAQDTKVANSIAPYVRYAGECFTNTPWVF